MYTFTSDQLCNMPLFKLHAHCARTSFAFTIVHGIRISLSRIHFFTREPYSMQSVVTGHQMHHSKSLPASAKTQKHGLPG
jgi:hypothetical protein